MRIRVFKLLFHWSKHDELTEDTGPVLWDKHLPPGQDTHYNISVCSCAALLYGRCQFVKSVTLDTKPTNKSQLWMLLLIKQLYSHIWKLLCSPLFKQKARLQSTQCPCARPGQQLRFVAILKTLSPKAFLSHSQNPLSWRYQVRGRFLAKDGQHRTPISLWQATQLSQQRCWIHHSRASLKR